MQDFFTHFRFLSPYWMLLFIPIAALAFLRRGNNSGTTLTFSTLSVLVSLGQKLRTGPGGFFFPLILLGAALATLAASRPVWQREYQKHSSSGIDIMVAFDLSLSMKISDFLYEGSPMMRVDAAKKVVKEFINYRPSDRIGLVVFSGQPYRISPITIDHEIVLDRLDFAEPNENRFSNRAGTIREQGTAIGSALAASAARLNEQKAKSKIIVLITDGANNSGKISPIDAAKYAADLGIKIYTIAIGTTEGRVPGNIQLFPRQEFDLPTLKEVARLTGGEHYWAQTFESLQQTFQTINNLEKSESKSRTITDNKELFAWFAIPAFLCLLIAALEYAPRPQPSA